jgi:hypothetical protein
MKLVLALLLMGSVIPTAQAGCRRAGVEWIVGGPAPVDCDAPATAANTTAGDARLKVSPASQRQRDEERQRILAQELAQEERQLPRALDADSVLRTRDNIAALKREMARLNVATR